MSGKDLEVMAITLARIVARHLPKKYVFTLILANTAPGGSIGYASSKRRDGMRHVLQRLLDTTEPAEETVWS